MARGEARSDTVRRVERPRGSGQDACMTVKAMADAGVHTGPVARRWITAVLLPALLLAGFWLLMVASIRGKSLTYDEGIHLTGGTTYWKFDDYRINAENGNLPQRLMA